MIGEDSGITIGLVITITFALAGLWWRLEAKFAAIEQNRLKLEREFTSYQIHAERYFVSTSLLEKTENRLVNAVDRLTARVETLISRMEGMRIDPKQHQPDHDI